METPQEEAAINQALDGNGEYRSFIDKLTESNVDRYINLPMIAVMGDTSSGKSSLLSNLSLIELPSADELTTRCPIMLKMNRSATKSATVNVVWKDVPDQTKSTTVFQPESFDETNWNDLTASIARAQKHIVEVSQKEVARDVVSVRISGPQCEALTLIDLPGIVRSTGKGESESLAGDIQSLIDDYLKNPRCIILAVHPSNVDFHNSQIMAEARKVDPQTKRTIPVLTKPDLIDDGAEKSVLDLLLGLKTDAFEKGFHMVKGRSQASLNTKDSIELGLNNEEAFFRNKQPWRDVEDKNLFGTKNLRVKLSLLLMQLIRDTFPEIVAELKSEKTDTFLMYSLLGEAPTTLPEKRIYFSQAKDEYIKLLRTILLGGSMQRDHGTIEKKCAAEFHLFCKKYRNVLNTTKLANVSDISVGDYVIAIDQDDEVHEGKAVLISEHAVYLQDVFYGDSIIDKTKKRSFSGDPIVEIAVGTVWQEKDYRLAYQATSKGCRKLYKFDRKNVSPDPQWILNLIIGHRPYSLPVFVNNELFDFMVSDFIEKQWTKPSTNLVEDISCTIKQSLYAELDKSARIRRFPKLLFFMKRRIEQVTEELTSKTLQKVLDFIKSEKIPYSQDHYLFENVTRMRSQHLKDEILRLVRSSGDSEVVSKNATVQIIEGVFERNQRKSVDNHMAEEMMHILSAYGKVALKRFCDTIPMLCGEGLLHCFADRFNEVLTTITDKELQTLMHVPREEETRRSNLKRKLEALEQGVSVFVELF